MTGILMFIVAILIVVMVHEAGHFLVAKAFGFKATKFFLGFGPTVWSTQRGETEYGIKALPLGGFVKIVGMNPYEEIPPEDLPRAYASKPRWQRALLLLAGSATHWPLALIILGVTAMTIGFPTGRVTTELSVVQTRVEGAQSPAAAAGFRPDDRIVKAGRRPVDSWGEVSEYIRSHPGEPITFEVERAGNRVTITATPGTAIFNPDGRLIEYAPPSERLRDPRPGETAGGFLGISPEDEFKREGLFGAIGSGAYWTGQTTVRAAQGIWSFFGSVFGGELWDALTGDEPRDPQGALGLVGAGRIASDAVDRANWLQFIGLIVGFIISVGIMNLLPLPPLDGGHLAVVGIEAVTGKPVDIRKLIPIAAAVISFFVVVFFALLYLDVRNPIPSPF